VLVTAQVYSHSLASDEAAAAEKWESSQAAGRELQRGRDSAEEETGVSWAFDRRALAEAFVIGRNSHREN
jgi:hypothetical protein